MTNSLGLAALGALMLSVACGGDDGGSTANTSGTGPTGPLSLEQLPAEIGATVCNALAPCCSEAGIAIDAATCRASLSSAFRQTIQQSDSSLYTYDAAAAGRCVTALRSQMASASCDEGGGLSAGVTCDEAFVGTLAPGETCTGDVECAPGPEPGDEVSCARGFDAPDRCVIERRAGEGDPCYWSCEERGLERTCFSSGLEEPDVQGRCFVGDGLRCSSDAVCLALGVDGDACGFDGDCVPETFCEGDSGTCTPRIGEGDACGFDGGCVAGLYCDGAACAPQRATGEPCDASEQCAGGSCDDAGSCAEGGLGAGLGIELVCALAGGGLSQ